MRGFTIEEKLRAISQFDEVMVRSIAKFAQEFVNILNIPEDKKFQAISSFSSDLEKQFGNQAQIFGNAIQRFNQNLYELISVKPEDWDVNLQLMSEDQKDLIIKSLVLPFKQMAFKSSFDVDFNLPEGLYKDKEFMEAINMSDEEFIQKMKTDLSFQAKMIQASIHGIIRSKGVIFVEKTPQQLVSDIDSINAIVKQTKDIRKEIERGDEEESKLDEDKTSTPPKPSGGGVFEKIREFFADPDVPILAKITVGVGGGLAVFGLLSLLWNLLSGSSNQQPVVVQSPQGNVLSNFLVPVFLTVLGLAAAFYAYKYKDYFKII